MKLTRDLEVAYPTYLGGSDEDTAHAIAVASSGAAWVVGSTASIDFPVSTPLPFGGRIIIRPLRFGDGFAARLGPDERYLRFAILGGPEADDARAVAGRVWIGLGVRTVCGNRSLPATVSQTPRGPRDDACSDAALVSRGR